MIDEVMRQLEGGSRALTTVLKCGGTRFPSSASADVRQATRRISEPLQARTVDVLDLFSVHLGDLHRLVAGHGVTDKLL